MFQVGQTSYSTILVKSSILRSISIILQFYCKNVQRLQFRAVKRSDSTIVPILKA